MNRSCRRPLCLLAGLLGIVAAVFTVGCGPALTAMYLMGGADIPAEYKGLRGKRVVVVCRPVATAQFQNPNVARDIARQVGQLLKANMFKVEIIDHRKVAEWMDTHTWEEYSEVGKALDAEMVVGIELEQFGILQGQTLYQGSANVILKVYDCASASRDPAFEKTMPRVVYPPNSGIPTSDKQEGQFRQEFIRKLAEQISRHFYDHDPRVDFASAPDAFN